jgi:hypothetical protein
MKRFAVRRNPRHARRRRNWNQIDANLVRRGDLTVWIDQEAIDRWEHPPKTGRPGRPRRYDDLAIRAAYTLKAIYGMPLRQTEGFLRSIFDLMRLPLAVPDFTTLPRRMPGLEIKLPRRAKPSEAVHLVIDSTGLKVFGAGEWHQHKHGPRKRRAYRKLHLLIDADTGEILASELTSSSVTDGEMLPIFLERAEEPIAALSADGTYDQEPCYRALAQRGSRAIIPPRVDAVLRADDGGGGLEMRNENLREIERIGKERWKHKRGYYRQSMAENGMSRYKRTFGERLSCRLFASQKNEARLNTHLLNVMFKLPGQAA